MPGYEFKFNKLLYSLFAAGMMFPITVAITPLYLLLRNLHLINSHLGIILPQIAFGLPQAIIILVPFLKSIPKELEEAAELDGCSPHRLLRPYGAAVELARRGRHPELREQLERLHAAAVPAQRFQQVHLAARRADVQLPAFGRYRQVLAFTSLSMIPALICFTIFQKKIVGGLTGAVKG